MMHLYDVSTKSHKLAHLYIVDSGHQSSDFRVAHELENLGLKLSECVIICIPYKFRFILLVNVHAVRLLLNTLK